MPPTWPAQVPVINHFLHDLERNGAYTGEARGGGAKALYSLWGFARVTLPLPGCAACSHSVGPRRPRQASASSAHRGRI
jgi:hypothetical protein